MGETTLTRWRYQPGLAGGMMADPEGFWMPYSEHVSALETLERERDQALKIERLALTQVKDTTATLEKLSVSYMRLRDLLPPAADRDEPLTQQECETAIVGLRSRVAALEAALEPVIRIAKDKSETYVDWNEVPNSTIVMAAITVGELRSVLSAKSEGTGR